MKGFLEIDLLLITNSDLGAYAAFGALIVAIISYAFNHLGSLLKNKGEIVSIGTKLDRAIQDIEKNEDDIKEVRHDISKVEQKVASIETASKHKDMNC